jgi:hypothetical protein
MSDKTIVQKMLIKQGQRFLLLNGPGGYAARLSDLPEGVTAETTLGGPADVIQCFITSKKQLEETLPTLKSALKPGGILWITYPKLTSRLAGDINRDSINAYAMTLGLQGVAMIAIDDDWAALRLKVV